MKRLLMTLASASLLSLAACAPQSAVGARDEARSASDAAAQGAVQAGKGSESIGEVKTKLLMDVGDIKSIQQFYKDEKLKIKY